ncbi:MAG TPA: FAD-linked oxidase C-terminal domain-containing protein [Streptosporangiaceae bacterium]
MIDDLAGKLPDGRVVTDPAIVDAYRRDQTHPMVPGVPLGLVRAHTTGDVVTTLRWANENRVPVVPRGGGTSLAGGATAVDGCVVLSLAAMTAIRELSADDQFAVAEAGVVNADLGRAAAAQGLMYAPDPSSFEVSTVGGNMATNAGGLRCVKYGVTRDSALGLEVVLADGRVIDTGRRTVKGVTGYDLTGLFVGSEGTLGVITAATVRLRRLPRTEPATVVASFGTLRAAADAVYAIVRAGLEPSMLELIDRAHLRALEAYRPMGLDTEAAGMIVAQSDAVTAQADAEAMAKLCRTAGARDALVSSDATEAAELVAVRRMCYPATEHLGANLVEDVCVPRSALPEMIEAVERAGERHGVMTATVAHAGDGNLHPVFIYEKGGTEVPEQVWAAADEVFRTAIALGGTLTGEHGVGRLKRRWLDQELAPDVLDVHHDIKRALDPNGILNPGAAV